MPESFASPFVTTETATLVPDEATPYRRLRRGPGEAHLTRTDLLPAVRQSDSNAGKTASEGNSHHVAGLIHFTDFQIADLASPSRVEYLQRLVGVPTWERMLPAYRPQEFLLAQAIEATVRSINAFVRSDPQRWDLALTTGDNTDSAQANELAAFLTYLEGGTIAPASGTNNFADAPVGSGNPSYYNPEPESQDVWKTRQGLPTHPGALAAAAAPFEGEGLGLPWLSCFGNHDCLVQGRAAAPEGYRDFLVSDSKPVALDPAVAPEGDKLSAYVQDPRWASGGEQHQIEPRTDRAMVSKAEYVAAHLTSPGLPTGHGFTASNQEEGTAYFVYDALPGVRLIVLDTTNVAGHVDGCVDAKQFEWLEARLAEAHSTHLDAEGHFVRSGGEDRVVVLASHHGLSTMNNNYGEYDQDQLGARGTLHLASDVRALLHRFPNVALWLSGHTHVNKITARPAPHSFSAEAGFWEISTGSIAEWPVQFRSIEILAEQDGLRVRTTMVDSQVPPAPDGNLTLNDLASLHREIAANDAGSVGGLYAEGKPEDRNQDLLVPVSDALLSSLKSLTTRPTTLGRK